MSLGYFDTEGMISISAQPHLVCSYSFPKFQKSYCKMEIVAVLPYTVIVCIKWIIINKALGEHWKKAKIK